MKTKRLLSVLLALLLILIYVPGTAAVSEDNGVEVKSSGNNWLHVHLNGQTNSLGQNVSGYAYFDVAGFGEGFDIKSFQNLKAIGEGENPFVGIPGINATHAIKLEQNGGKIECNDSGLFVSKALVGIMVTKAESSENFRTSSLLGSDDAKPLLFTKNNFRTSGEGSGSLNVFLLKPYWEPAKITLIKSADPTDQSTVKPGDIITYSINVKNDVPWYGSKAYFVNVADQIPSGTSYESGSAMLGNSIAPEIFNKFGLNIYVGDLAPQQEQNVSFKVKVDDIDDELASSEIANRAYASYITYRTGIAYRSGPLAIAKSNWVKHTVIEPKIDIEGSKIWDDYSNVGRFRPNSIIINLFQSLADEVKDGEVNDIATRDVETPFMTQTIYENGTDEWGFLFEDVPEFDSEGNKYIYRVDEEYLTDNDRGDYYNKSIDGFMITNDLDLAPGIAITKTVANLTTGGARGAEADIEVGETAGYEVTISNTGALDIDSVILRDDMAEIGQVAIDQFDNEYTFEDDGNGVACIYFGSLEEGENVLVLSYQYTATADDVDISPIVNTASVEALIYKPETQPMTRVAAEAVIIEPSIVWTAIKEASASITVTAPPVETTTGETTTTGGTTTTGETTGSDTLPSIDYSSESVPLAVPDPTTLPTIKPIADTVPLATVETIEVAREQIPKSGESAPLWPIGLALLAIAGGLGLIVHKSKKQTDSDVADINLKK